MNYRRALTSDLEDISRIYKQQSDKFDLPIPDSKVAGVAEDAEGKVIGFVMVRMIAETIMVLDLERNKRDRIEALKELFSGALFESCQLDIDQIHAFVQDPKLSELLKKHFGFKNCEGESLVLDTEK